MTTRQDSNRGSKKKDESLAAAAVIVIAGGFVVLLVVRWLSRQSPLTLAGLATATAVVLFACWAVWPRQRLPRHRVRHMRIRARLRLHPGRGHATVAELSLRWGRLAAARRARRSRRSLPWRARLLRASQTSVLLARGHYGHRLRVPVEEHVIYVAPPRAGKTGTLADIIARYPGPVVATSTRGDLYELTAQARAARGPVHVWNPQRLADVPSTMRWDVLGGCADPATAIRRARPLSSIASFKGEGEDFWAASVALWMQTLLHVAALQQTTMDQVHSWALQKVPEDFLAALPAAGGEAERWGHLIKGQMTSEASRTTDTIRYMLAASLAFMVDPMLRTAVQPGPGQFDPARFIAEGGTLYLIAESRDERPLPGGRPVRRAGHGDLPPGRADRRPHARRPARSADAVAPG